MAVLRSKPRALALWDKDLGSATCAGQPEGSWGHWTWRREKWQPHYPKCVRKCLFSSEHGGGERRIQITVWRRRWNDSHPEPGIGSSCTKRYHRLLDSRAGGCRARGTGACWCRRVTTSKHLYHKPRVQMQNWLPLLVLVFKAVFFFALWYIDLLNFWFILAFGLLHSMNSLAPALSRWSSQCLFLLIKIFPSVHVRAWSSGHLTNSGKKKNVQAFLSLWLKGKGFFSSFLTLFLTTPGQKHT